MPATVLAEQVGREGSIRWFRDNVIGCGPSIGLLTRRTGWSGSLGARRSVTCG
jgi:hypothetical protein